VERARIRFMLRFLGILDERQKRIAVQAIAGEQ
jgi:hypothetical protein